MIDDHPTERKDSMEHSNGRTCHYHGMNDCALRTRSSVLHRFWSDHISDKVGGVKIRCEHVDLNQSRIV